MRLLNRSVGASVVLLLGVAACGDDSTASQSLATESAPTISANEETATTSTVPATTSTAPATTSTVLATTSTAREVTDQNDPADAYLDRTMEIYRRALPNGQDFVVRVSAESYATVFGLRWTAPTGSADACLGNHAVFLGVPGHIGPWGSAWIAGAWFDAIDPAQPVVLQASMSAADNTIPTPQYLVVRTAADASEVVLSSMDGTQLDRSTVTNGIAMLVVDAQALGEGQTMNDVRVTVVTADGQSLAPSPLTPSTANIPSDCGPGKPPPRPLPQPGVQPDDPDAAATQIRQRHALLVDLSVPFDQKPANLLDDDTGVQDALATLDAGHYRDVAASATYSIDELVFTQPDEAWFRYTITTSTTTYSDEFGIAVIIGGAWQITRATICQDLAAALAPCQPTPEPISPPTTPEWEAAWQEWMSRANLYMGNDGCPPLSQC